MKSDFTSESFKKNSAWIFLSAVWWLDALKRREKIIQKRLLNKEVKMLGLKCNLGLALIGLQTTGLCSPFETPYVAARS